MKNCIKRYDDQGNIIYYKCYHHQREYRKEYDKDNNLIYFNNYSGIREFYKYENNKRIKIAEQEFKQIKFLKNKVRRWEILDI